MTQIQDFFDSMYRGIDNHKDHITILQSLIKSKEEVMKLKNEQIDCLIAGCKDYEEQIKILKNRITELENKYE